jgi:hypothetical protein
MDLFVYKGVHDLNIYKKNQAQVKKKNKKASLVQNAFFYETIILNEVTIPQK